MPKRVATAIRERITPNLVSSKIIGDIQGAWQVKLLLQAEENNVGTQFCGIYLDISFALGRGLVFQGTTKIKGREDDGDSVSDRESFEVG